MYKIAVCDGDAAFCRAICSDIKRIMDGRQTEYSLAYYTDAKELDKALHSDRVFDLIFMETVFGEQSEFKLAEQSGLELARQMRRQDIDSEIVFVTSHKEHAADSFDVEPLHFLIKGESVDKLDEAMRRFFAKKERGRLCISTAKGTAYLPYSDIMYCEIFGHDITVYTVSGEKEYCRGTLKGIEQLLPSSNFVRLHRSYLINLDCVSQITHNSITLGGGLSIPLSRSTYKNIQLAMQEYIGSRV